MLAGYNSSTQQQNTFLSVVKDYKPLYIVTSLRCPLVAPLISIKAKVKDGIERR